MGAVDVSIDNDGFIIKRVADETLGSQVVALVRLNFLNHTKNAGEGFQGAGVEGEPVDEGVDVREAVKGIFEVNAHDNAVDLVAVAQQQFGEKRSVLTGDAGNECFLHKTYLHNLVVWFIVTQNGWKGLMRK